MDQMVEQKLPLSITFSYPHGNGFDPAWVESLTGLLLYETQKPKEERVLGSILKAGSCYVDSNRNEICLNFNNISQDDWLMMVDPDIQFKPTILEQAKVLIEQNPEAKIISGRVNLLNGLPVFYNINPETGNQVHQPFAFKGLKKFDLVGTGIIFIKREVFKLMVDKYKNHHFFQRILTSEGFSLGDDFSFCLRARDLGIDLYGAWEIEGIHWKTRPCENRYLELAQLEIRK